MLLENMLHVNKQIKDHDFFELLCILLCLIQNNISDNLLVENVVEMIFDSVEVTLQIASLSFFSLCCLGDVSEGIIIRLKYVNSPSL